MKIRKFWRYLIAAGLFSLTFQAGVFMGMAFEAELWHAVPPLIRNAGYDLKMGCHDLFWIDHENPLPDGRKNLWAEPRFQWSGKK